MTTKNEKCSKPKEKECKSTDSKKMSDKCDKESCGKE